jgi:UDP:flavonoid glycosyltransferase YjiC (YdhE family)
VKIIINAQGSQGDIAPVLPLAAGLRKAGHTVSVCAPVNFSDFFAHAGLSFHPVGPDTRALLNKKKTGFASPLKAAFTVISAIRQSIPYYFSTLLPLAKDADLYLGAGVDLCGHSIADFCKIPYRYILCIPQMLASHYHPPLFFPYRSMPPAINSMLWHISDFIIDTSMGLKRIHNSHRKHLKLPPVPHFMAYMVENVIVAADPELAPIPEDVKAQYAQTGYFHAVDDTPLDEDLCSFIDSGPPPVFIGFGSMPQPGSTKLANILQEAITSYEHRFIVSRGWADLPLAEAGRNIRLVDYVPYTALFPKMSLIVHHGGAGTTHSAARAGVPQLVIPHVLDQFYWADRVYQLGLGPKPIKRSALTRTNLIHAIMQAIGNPGYKEKAKTISHALCGRNPVQAAVEIIDRIPAC